MVKTVTTPWDPADHFHTEEDMAAYLEAALEECDPTVIAAAPETTCHTSDSKRRGLKPPPDTAAVEG